MKRIAQSLLFSTGMVLSTAVVASLVLLCFMLPFHQRYRLAKLWSRFNLWWLKCTCGIDYVIRGQENIPEGPMVVMVKHQSTWETMFLQFYMPPQSWVIKRELLWVPWFGWGISLLKPISIDRKSSSVAVRQILAQGKKHLDDGISVLIFPEGTRTAPGQKKRYGLGGSRLAIHAGYPVLPVAHNAGEFWPRRSFFKHPGTITLEFGPVISSEGKNIHTLNAEVEAWIEGKMAEISPRYYPPLASPPEAA